MGIIAENVEGKVCANMAVRVKLASLVVAGASANMAVNAAGKKAPSRLRNVLYY